VGSKLELKERIIAGIEEVNRYPVVRTWSYKLAEAAFEPRKRPPSISLPRKG
jgi:hypothetical protein